MDGARQSECRLDVRLEIRQLILERCARGNRNRAAESRNETAQIESRQFGPDQVAHALPQNRQVLIQLSVDGVNQVVDLRNGLFVKIRRQLDRILIIARKVPPKSQDAELDQPHARLNLR